MKFLKEINKILQEFLNVLYQKKKFFNKNVHLNSYDILIFKGYYVRDTKTQKWLYIKTH